MPDILSMKTLRAAVQNGSVDTVIAAFPDMQGRLMGKRFHAQFFIDHAWEETHCCNYLIATDLEMATVDGYASTSWSSGYGDYVMRPDLDTLCMLPWLDATALVLCDLLDHHTHELVPHAPRTILKQQLKRAADIGLSMMAATELEFFVFRESFETIRDADYHAMTPISAYNEDYHIFQTTKEESLMRQIRNGLYGAGITVENTKGEADAGQAEINVHYADALRMGDVHVMVKNAVKEIAFLNDRAVTFLAKWHHHAAGSSSHIHQSLCSAEGNAMFFDPAQPHGMSQMMQSYLAGRQDSSASSVTYHAVAPGQKTLHCLQRCTVTGEYDWMNPPHDDAILPKMSPPDHLKRQFLLPHFSPSHAHHPCVTHQRNAH